MNKPESSIKQAFFAVSVIIVTAIILGTSLTVSSLQVVDARQESPGPEPKPKPKLPCCINSGTDDKCVPCPQNPSFAHRTPQADTLPRDNGIIAEPLQTAPSSPIKSDRGTISGERLAEEEPMQFSTSNEENPKGGELTKSENPDMRLNSQINDEDSNNVEN